MNESTDLMKFGDIQGVAERPKSLKHETGAQDIDTEGIRLPRLSIAQGLSPQITPGDVQQIEGLALFDMFNDITGEIYGKGPITFVPVKAYTGKDARRIEFRPRSEGGGIIDMDVPPGDPRLDWTVEDGVRKPPRATTFQEYVIILLRSGKAPEPIVLSIKGTNKHNRRASDYLTSTIGFRPGRIFSGMYTVDTKVPVKNDKGTFGVPRIKNAGFVPVDTPAGSALYEFAEKFHDSLEGKTIIVERETLDENEADTFDEPMEPPQNTPTDM